MVDRNRPPVDHPIPDVQRRRVLAGSLVGVSGVAGCQGDGGQSVENPTATDGPTAPRQTDAGGGGAAPTEIEVTVDRYGGDDIGEAFNNAREEHGVFGNRYTLERGFHTLRTPMNLTSMSTWEGEKGSTGLTLDMRGVVLEQACPLAIDVTGSHNAVQIWGGQIWGDHKEDIEVGMLLSREVDGGNGGRNEFYGLKIAGRYPVAALYNVGTEVNDFVACEFLAKRFGQVGPDGCMGVSISGDNPNGIESPYSAVDAGSYTTGGNKFFGSVLRGHTGVRLRSGRGNPVRLTKFYGTYMGAVDEVVQFDMANSRGMDNIVFRDCWVGDATTSYIFRVVNAVGEASVSDLVVDGGRFALGPDADTPEIAFGGNRSLRLERAHIRPNVQWLRNNGFQLGDVVDSDIQANVDEVRVDGDLRQSTLGANSLEGIETNGSLTRSRLIGLQGGRRQLVDDSNSLTTRFDRQGLPRFENPDDAPADCLFYDTDNERVAYKALDGTIHQLS
jgi:hypothetical protein